MPELVKALMTSGVRRPNPPGVACNDKSRTLPALQPVVHCYLFLSHLGSGC